MEKEYLKKKQVVFIRSRWWAEIDYEIFELEVTFRFISSTLSSYLCPEKLCLAQIRGES